MWPLKKKKKITWILSLHVNIWPLSCNGLIWIGKENRCTVLTAEKWEWYVHTSLLSGQRSKDHTNQSPKLVVKDIVVFVCHSSPNAGPKIKWVIKEKLKTIMRMKKGNNSRRRVGYPREDSHVLLTFPS